MSVVRAVLRVLVTAGALAAIVVAGDVGAGFGVAAFADVAPPAAMMPAPAVRDAHAVAPALLVFGDSLAYGYQASPGHGWVDLLRDRLAVRDPRSVVVDLAVDGSRVIDLRRQVELGPLPGAARAVVVVAGGNDLMSVTDPYGLARADAALLRDIRGRYPQARVVVANIPDISWRSFHLRRDAPPEPLPVAYRIGLSWLTDIDNAIVDRLASRFGADVLDLHRLTLEGDRSMTGLQKPSLEDFSARYVGADGLHPSDAGYALLARFAWPHVARAMGVTP